MHTFFVVHNFRWLCFYLRVILDEKINILYLISPTNKSSTCKNICFCIMNNEKMKFLCASKDNDEWKWKKAKGPRRLIYAAPEHQTLPVRKNIWRSCARIKKIQLGAHPVHTYQSGLRRASASYRTKFPTVAINSILHSAWKIIR